MKKSKSMKVAEYFLANPSAVPKVVGAKFKVAMPSVYAIRKRVLSGSMLDQAHPVVEHKPFVPSTKADALRWAVTTTRTWVCNLGKQWNHG
jgi:hypothetical protein